MEPTRFLPFADVKLNEPMAKHTTFRIGGAADLFLLPHNSDGVKECFRLCREENIPVFWLGSGSNLLVSDKGIRGAVISLAKACAAVKAEGETVTAGAGARLLDVCRAAEENALTGLEFAYGIPGSVGGSVYMNAGAYGGELCDVLRSVTVLYPSGERRTYSSNECDFAYRHSRFMQEDGVITEATFALKKGNKDEIHAAMADFLARRKDKQPLNYPSAGSVFRRPTGYFAGALIEGASLKGASVGDAQVSEKHAGFIINKGKATAADVTALIALIQKKVAEKDGVNLVCEIRTVGEP